MWQRVVPVKCPQIDYWNLLTRLWTLKCILLSSIYFFSMGEADETQFGFWWFRPKSLQWLSNFIPFMSILSANALLQGAIVNGLVSVSISSIEKRWVYLFSKNYWLCWTSLGSNLLRRKVEFSRPRMMFLLQLCLFHLHFMRRKVTVFRNNLIFEKLLFQGIKWNALEFVWWLLVLAAYWLSYQSIPLVLTPSEKHVKTSV